MLSGNKYFLLNNNLSCIREIIKLKFNDTNFIQFILLLKNSSTGI